MYGFSIKIQSLSQKSVFTVKSSSANRHWATHVRWPST